MFSNVYFYKEKYFIFNMIHITVLIYCLNRISCSPRVGQTKDYKLRIHCFSALYAALRSKKKDQYSRNKGNVSEWSEYKADILIIGKHSLINTLLAYFASFLSHDDQSTFTHCLSYLSQSTPWTSLYLVMRENIQTKKVLLSW